MLAATYSEYGSPDQIHVRETPVPTLGEHDVLVRVAAVALNASDVEFLRANPAYVRAWGLLKPRHPILGSDVAGHVEAVGSKVTKFKPGDRVFADLLERWGGLAEYVSAPERLWAQIPDELDFVAACMVPQAGVVALQAVRAGGDLKGKSLLINGAGGGSGTFAIQFAKGVGAGRITAVDRAAKAAAMLKLGADEVVDFAREDYSKRHGAFDVIVDLVGSRRLADNARALAPNGRYFLVGGPLARILGAISFGAMRSMFSSRRYRLLAVKQSPAAFSEVAASCVSGQVKPVLGQTFPLAEVRSAFRALEAGEVSGKVVVTI